MDANDFVLDAEARAGIRRFVKEVGEGLGSWLNVLLDAAEEAEALRSVLAGVEWGATIDDRWACPECCQPKGGKHDPDCRVGWGLGRPECRLAR